MNKDYEGLFIYNQDESLYKESKKKIEELFKEHNVVIKKETDMGIKEFGHEIKKNKQGHYYNYHIEANGLHINKLNKEIKMQETILRFLFTYLDKNALEVLKKKEKIKS